MLQLAFGRCRHGRATSAAISPSPPTPTTSTTPTITIRGQWFDDLTIFWREFAKPGRLPQRHYDARVVQHMNCQPEHGTLAARVSGGSRRAQERALRHQLELPGGRDLLVQPHQAGRSLRWRGRTRLAQLLCDAMGGSAASARDMPSPAGTNCGKQTFAFRDSLFGTTMPPDDHRRGDRHDGAARTATVIRSKAASSGPGRASTPGRLLRGQLHACVELPAGARPFCSRRWSATLRETEFTYNQLPNGGLTFRQTLPLGAGFDRIGPCADGHFGAIIKTYRDWKIVGRYRLALPYWSNMQAALSNMRGRTKIRT